MRTGLSIRFSLHFCIALLLTSLPAGALAAAANSAGGDTPRVLRVCADPNNLPFSNRQLEGFENRLVELIADKLDRKLEYTWWPQRRGFLRNTLYANKCDLVPGIPSSHEMVLSTRSYYRSSYVFLQRADSPIKVSSFDDPALRKTSVGVHLIGDDGNNSPPAHALARRGIIDNVVGYTVYGDYSTPNPPSRLVQAVAAGEIDVGVVWGPLAGYFAPKQAVELVFAPVSPIIDIPALPFVFSISMGVRLTDSKLKADVDEVLHAHRPEVEKILSDFGVPQN